MNATDLELMKLVTGHAPRSAANEIAGVTKSAAENRWIVNPKTGEKACVEYISSPRVARDADLLDYANLPPSRFAETAASWLRIAFLVGIAFTAGFALGARYAYGH